MLPLEAHDQGHEPQPLAAGKSVSSESRIFWARRGFAFEQPGRHEVNVVLVWEDDGAYFAVESSAEVWVNYPISERDNEIASLMMNDEVGRFVLTSNTKRFAGGARRINEVIKKHKAHAVSKTLTQILRKRSPRKKRK